MSREKGYKHSKATKHKMSLAAIGKPKSMKARKKMSDYAKQRRWLGGHVSEAGKQRLREIKTGNKNPNWKGDNIKSINAIHTWIRRHNVPPSKCEFCKKEFDKLDLSNKKGHKYTRNIKDYQWLCRKCHKKIDFLFRGEKEL